MWRSNMAAPERGEWSDLTSGNSGCPARGPLNELVLSRSHGESVERSILAIFEDATVSSESTNAAEEGSESLLRALTEMLDRVGQDGDADEIFSPFDVLPNTDLLRHAEHKDEPRLQEPSPAHRLRPRPKPPNETATTRSDGKQKAARRGPPHTFKKHNQTSSCSKTTTPKAEVEVFTSTSLVSLVKLMHPYCLKLRVEKEDEPRGNTSPFAQEEVWRYERPSEESDEEINVVSDDEAPVKGTQEEEEEEEGGGRGSGSPLKSVLLNGKPSREKKRVSFGPVHVASFDESEEDDFKGGKLNSSESVPTPDDPSGPAPPPSAPPSERREGVAQEKKGEKKPKSLSLQEYRQLRLTRAPPVERQGNYSTRWPRVSELPKELPPILILCGPNAAPVVRRASSTQEARIHNHPHDGRLGSSQPEPRNSPAAPLPDAASKRGAGNPESGKSPAKRPQRLSSDPPNPVLVPLPAPQTLSPPSEPVGLHSSRHPQDIQNKSSAAPPVRPSEPKPRASPLEKDVKAVDATPHPDIKAKQAELAPHVSSESPRGCGPGRTAAAEQSSGPDPGRRVESRSLTPPLSQPPSPTEAHMTPKEESPDSTRRPEEPEPPQSHCREDRAASGSGIEAADLTSLLEQFEETQAIDDGVCSDAASSSVIEGNHQLDLDRPGPAGSEQTSESPLKPTAEILEPQSTDLSLEDVQTLDVPEPLSTEIVLSTQKNQQNPRCRNLSLKPIQIIDPRPLPPRKARTSQSEPSAAQTSLHVYSYLCFDHDYCGSVDHPLQAKQPSEATTEPEPTTRGSGASGGGGGHLSDNQASVPLQRSDQTRTASEAETRAGEASPLIAAVQGGGEGTALCGLPTPPPTPPVRGRSKRRYRRRSPRSDSSSSSCSSSCSCSPKRPRVRRGRSESSSCSSSPSSSSCASPPRRYRMSCPRSWSRSRSRSPSPQIYHRSWRDVSSSRESRRRSREHEMRIQKLKAIDERRVVYVGRIRRTMTHDELRERFSQFGEVECVSLHFRDSGDHYGFVTFYNTEDAFAAIDNGGKLRRPNELPFDLCFGGRRQFCNSDYADLDANREADPPPPRSRFEDLDFDSLLKQAQKGQKR